ncbi:LacI family transcriptional regulator [Paraburkholderia sp. Cy-641]|uniref:LacI family DNA-binding transcriptional regulator n=1 Tax=Paraburkholderia sp. Cy-641 TaxID=2608337 RepID=UPI0014213D4C|nr:LacI family DNA-binding transcriptional regulator [Paraburkholderia sp. Cy-641]NIF78105.1 LacI family transcriptional regulator [Paraburkholderia sp. Cy-641]
MSDTQLKRRDVTAHDVAKIAGVSQSAVSRVFTPGASVSPGTRERVLKAANQLGYRPNLVARSLITRRSHLIGVAVPANGNPFYLAALNALATAFSRVGYGMLMFPSDPLLGTDPILEDVLRYRVDALVLISIQLSSRFADECMQIGLPVVMVNRRTDSEAVSTVTGQNVYGARTIAAFLHAGEHHRYAYVAGLPGSSTSRDREEGFVEYLEEQGVRNITRRVGQYTAAGAEEAVISLLSLKKPPDAIFCANDHMALAAISIASKRYGYEIGTDLSIVGFDNIEMASWPIFSLTSFSQPLDAMLKRAVSKVLAQLNGMHEAPSHDEVVGELIVRNSARRPKTGVIDGNGYSYWHSVAESGPQG